MKIHYCTQGSAEWKALRAGCITASNFRMLRSKVGGLDERQSQFVKAVRGGASEVEAMAIAGYKAKPKAEAIERAIAGLPVGDYSETAKNYAFRLAIERISKTPLDEGFETWQMERGHELEPMARMEHEQRKGVMVETIGFITTDDGKFGCSVDGFIRPSRGAEYKCFISPEKLRAIYLTGDTSDVIDQCDGGMWITNWSEWDFALYCPALSSIGLDLDVYTIKRDDDRIFELEKDLVEFERFVSVYEIALRAKAERLAAAQDFEPDDLPPEALAGPDLFEQVIATTDQCKAFVGVVEASRAAKAPALSLDF